MNLPALGSKTVQLALLFALLGVLMILMDKGLIELTGTGLRYIPEWLAMLSTAIVAIAGKATIDNWGARTTPPPLPPFQPPQRGQGS